MPSKIGELSHFSPLPAYRNHPLTRFDITAMQSALASEHSAQLIHSLHAILKPFLLRRMKVDVEVGLPPKKEYVLYAPLSVRQKDVYDVIVNGGLRRFLLSGDKSTAKERAQAKKEAAEKALAAANEKRKLRGATKVYEDDDEDDDEYFDRMEKGDVGHRGQNAKSEKDLHELGREHQYQTTCESPRSPEISANYSSPIQ
jgi:ATP-dependent DNA helicase